MPQRLISKIPRKLLYLKIEGPGDTFIVPFPANFKEVTYRWSRALEEALMERPYHVVGHPESRVAVITEAKSYLREDNLFIIKSFFGFRVVIVNLTKTEGLEWAEWLPFEEDYPTKKEFKSDTVQRRIDKLRELIIRFQHGEEGEISLKPIKLNRSDLGVFVDRSVEILTELGDDVRVKDRLLGILMEADVIKRLDRALELYAFCLKDLMGWDEDLSKLDETRPVMSTKDLLESILKRPDGWSLDDSEPLVKDERRDLLRKILIRNEEGGGRNDA